MRGLCATCAKTCKQPPHAMVLRCDAYVADEPKGDPVAEWEPGDDEKKVTR